MTHKKKIHDDIEEELNVVADDPNDLLRDIKGFIKKVKNCFALSVILKNIFVSLQETA